MIHCIGDSHVSVFTGKDGMPFVWAPNQRSNDITEYFRTYRIGPATATGLNSKIPIINDVIQYAPVDKEKDKILFCFGEVDIRAHIMKEYLNKEKNLKELIEDSVNEYFKVIKYYKKEGYNMMIWGPIASWSDDKAYTTGPSFGTCLERNNVTELFNTYLETLCNENNVMFISIFDEMLLENGNTNPIYLDEWPGCHIHLVQTAFPLIIDKFKEKKLI